MRRRRAAAVVSAALMVGLLAVLLAAGGEARAPHARPSANAIQTGSGPYNAVSPPPASGIPPSLAKNFASLGYGYGYPFAQDTLCTIAESYVTVAAERSR